ncbi:MAG: hypothetical protein OXD44_03250 [Gammaproteobacteria bacterium]|nr:hypothetical protein [Gammaproteobacteria bacterium]
MPALRYVGTSAMQSFFHDTSDSAADSMTDMGNVPSRFGIKVNSDPGNGLTVQGRYEWQAMPGDW